MGCNSRNLFEEEVSNKTDQGNSRAMVTFDIANAGYQYIVPGDLNACGCNAGNELYPVPVQPANGIGAQAGYVYSKREKPGTCSDAAALICGGVTGSYNLRNGAPQHFRIGESIT